MSETWVGATPKVLKRVDPEMASPYFWLSTPLGQWRFAAGDLIMIEMEFYNDFIKPLKHPKLLNPKLDEIERLMLEDKFHPYRIP